MPTTTTLQSAVKTTLFTFLQQRTSDDVGDIAQDIYRTLRDEASLLLERQLMCDALDTDPFDLTREVSVAPGGDTPSDGEEGNIMEDDNGDDDGEADLLEKKKNRELITRFKDMVRVISCTRTATPDGYSSIQCVVQLDNDGKMQGVKEYIRLHFTFLREPQHDHVNGPSDDDDDDVKVIFANADDYFSGEEGGSDNDGCNDDAMGNVKNGKKEGVHGQPTKKRKRIANDSDAPPPANEDNDNVNVEIEDSGNDIPNNQPNNPFKPKTIVTYKIDYSIDSGKMEQLLGVDVLALGEHPSIEEAIPMMDDDDDDAEEGNPGSGDGQDEKTKQCAGANHNHHDKRLENKESNAKQSSPKNDTEFEEIEMSDHDSTIENNDPENNTNNGEGDRYGVFVNPQNVVAFLDRANMNFNEQSVFYFLMTLPFYEHEWDIAGFLLSALIEDEDELGEDEDEDSGNNGGCGKECSGDQP
mmetsp:Transcript_42739/g.89651  ORF Transcript_42739/g.89651 Transcript_42739/m.89651 type:complete len:470 (+) Transcript_42739:285-1694(+)